MVPLVGPPRSLKPAWYVLLVRLCDLARWTRVKSRLASSISRCTLYVVTQFLPSVLRSNVLSLRFRYLEVPSTHDSIEHACHCWYYHHYYRCLWTKTLLRRRGPLGNSAWKIPNQGLESSFCCRTARLRLVQKECFFPQTPVSSSPFITGTDNYIQIEQRI